MRLPVFVKSQQSVEFMCSCYLMQRHNYGLILFLRSDGVWAYIEHDCSRVSGLYAIARSNYDLIFLQNKKIVTRI